MIRLYYILPCLVLRVSSVLGCSWMMPTFSIVSTNIGRVTQVVGNARNGHTGPLSMATTFLTFAGALGYEQREVSRSGIDSHCIVIAY